MACHQVADRVLLVIRVVIDMKAVVLLPAVKDPINERLERFLLTRSIMRPEIDELVTAAFFMDRVPEKVFEAAVERETFNIEEDVQRARLWKRVEALWRAINTFRDQLE